MFLSYLRKRRRVAEEERAKSIKELAKTLIESFDAAPFHLKPQSAKWLAELRSHLAAGNFSEPLLDLLQEIVSTTKHRDDAYLHPDLRNPEVDFHTLREMFQLEMTGDSDGSVSITEYADEIEIDRDLLERACGDLEGLRVASHKYGSMLRVVHDVKHNWQQIDAYRRAECLEDVYGMYTGGKDPRIMTRWSSFDVETGLPFHYEPIHCTDLRVDVLLRYLLLPEGNVSAAYLALLNFNNSFPNFEDEELLKFHLYIAHTIEMEISEERSAVVIEELSAKGEAISRFVADYLTPGSIKDVRRALAGRSPDDLERQDLMRGDPSGIDSLRPRLRSVIVKLRPQPILTFRPAAANSSRRSSAKYLGRLDDLLDRTIDHDLHARAREAILSAI